LPRLGFTGTWKLTPTRRLIALGGSGLGGGSLLYANTTYIPEPAVFASEHWARSRSDWYEVLLPFYGLAQRMPRRRRRSLRGRRGSSPWRGRPRDGRGETYERVSMAVFQDYRRPRGRKPTPTSRCRSGAQAMQPVRRLHGRLPVRCQEHARPQFLYFASATGAEIQTEAEVTAISPLTGPDGRRDGSAGYELTVRATTGWLRKSWSVRTRGVVVSAGAMGTLGTAVRLQAPIPQPAGHLR